MTRRHLKRWKELLAEAALVSLMLGTITWGLSWTRNQVLRKVAADEKAAAAQERSLERIADAIEGMAR